MPAKVNEGALALILAAILAAGEMKQPVLPPPDHAAIVARIRCYYPETDLGRVDLKPRCVFSGYDDYGPESFWLWCWEDPNVQGMPALDVAATMSIVETPYAVTPYGLEFGRTDAVLPGYSLTVEIDGVRYERFFESSEPGYRVIRL